VNPRAVAVQGIGYSTRLVALQGFGFVGIVPEPEVSARRPKRHGIKAEFYAPDVSLDLLRQEDELATDLIIALLTKGFFDGSY
jgi:hypothetical protein